MNQKITLARLAALVAEKNGCSPKESEDVLRLLFQYIGASLEGGEPIKVKGMGTFKLSSVEARKSVDVTTGEENEIPAHRRIVFIPSKELAAAVNAPFEMFETVVIEENVLEEELMAAESENNELLVDSLQQQIILEEEKADELKEQYPAEFEDYAVKTAPIKPDLTKPDLTDTATAQDEATATSSESVAEDTAVQNVDDKSQSSEEGVESVEDSRRYDENVKEESQHTDASPTVSEDLSDDAESETPTPKKPHGFWIWYVVAGIVVIILGLGVLWMVNDDFASKGRELLGIEAKDSTSSNPQEAAEVATLLDNESNLTEENSDMTGIVEEEGQDPANDAKEAALAKSNEDAGSEAVPTAPSDAKSNAPEYDTITKTRYLTTLAKEHYGNFHLWPYIYKENEKILGHPDRIRPGTKVVIPDLSKYGVEPKNPNDIAKAKKLGVEIYNRYK